MHASARFDCARESIEMSMALVVRYAIVTFIDDGIFVRPSAKRLTPSFICVMTPITEELTKTQMSEPLAPEEVLLHLVQIEDTVRVIWHFAQVVWLTTYASSIFDDELRKKKEGGSRAANNVETKNAVACHAEANISGLKVAFCWIRLPTRSSCF